jgi:hypothetical protein
MGISVVPAMRGMAFYDRFDRPDSADVGNSWEQAAGAQDVWSIASNRLVGASTTSGYADKYLYRPAAEALENCEAWVDFNTPSTYSYPQVMLRCTDFDLLPTGYLFYVSTHATNKTGVIRLTNNTWSEQFIDAWTGMQLNHNYRLYARAITNGNQVDLTIRVYDLEATNSLLVDHTWANTNASRIVAPGRQGISLFDPTKTVYFQNFIVRER